MAEGRKTQSAPQTSVAPDQRQLTALQAQRLGAISGIDAKELTGVVHADVAEKFKWRVDPELLFMRRVCGQVVRRDAITGELVPVPFATVHVEDTDCSFISYFPTGWRWGWYYPFRCHREEIATVVTDECGRFCVWIPRFDIDWIVRWRAERICFDDIFVRPSIEDILDEYVDGPWPPIKMPDKGDPPPYERVTALAQLGRERLSAHIGDHAARRIDTAVRQLGFGASNTDVRAIGASRAFDHEMAPPMPEEFLALTRTGIGAGGGTLGKSRERQKQDDAVRATIAARLDLDPKVLATLDPSRFIGPFRRCFNVFVPEWTPILDVPDVTFRVTQDIDGDGTEETIYSEGYFDVRWNAGHIPDVTLMASPAAIASRRCGVPVVRCGNAPEIQFAGRMPLLNPPLPAPPYFDASSGFAKRPNRPRPSGVVGSPQAAYSETQTPFTRMISLYGCVEVAGAQFYRVLSRRDGIGSPTPLAVPPMNLHQFVGTVLVPRVVTPDAQGWYDVRRAADNWRPEGLIIDWPTSDNGLFEITLELGDASRTPIPGQVHTVNLHIDNSAPVVTYQTLRWKFASEGDSAFFGAGRSLLGACPTIRRGASPHDVEVLLEVNVSSPHLRDANIGASRCDLTTITPDGGTPSKESHWHTSGSDNGVLLFARYRVTSGDAEGAYSFGANGNSRAFNPAGGDNGLVSDWDYDVVYNNTPTAVHVAVINAA